jgi:integrase
VEENVEALERVKTLKHTREAIARDGEDALVFVTKKRQPYYREVEVIENGKVVGIKVGNAVSITFCRTAKKAKLSGVSFYRLRHTFKTLGKRAKDRDALNLCMGHQTNSVEEGYDHEKELGLIAFSRIRRVALKVKHRLWPKPKTVKADPATAPTPPLKIADAGPAESEAA